MPKSDVWYSSRVTNENYLRGVQESDVDGVLRFETIFPGCYPGRWPHIHFEVYPSLADATSVSNVRLPIPSLAEQRRIVEFLDCAETVHQCATEAANIRLQIAQEIAFRPLNTSES